MTIIFLEFLLKCYQIAHSKGKPASIVAEMVSNLVSEEENPEAVVLINILKSSERELSSFDVLQQGVDVKPTEKMIRMSIESCKEEIKNNTTNAPLAKLQLSSNFELLHDRGLATSEDYDFYFDLSEGAVSEDVLKSALEKNKKDPKLWSRLMALKVNEFLDLKIKKKEQAGEIMELFDEAISNIPTSESLPIWSLLIDFSVGYFGKNEIEKVFSRAITKTNGIVCGELKSIRLKYVKTVHGEGSEEYRKEYETLARKPPTSISFHLDYINGLEKLNVSLLSV